MSLKSVTTKITYKVPAWCHCNLQATVFGQPSSDKCRFCIKEKGQYRCALYNEVLSVNGILVNKARDCEKATAGYKSTVTDVTSSQTPSIEPGELAKAVLDEYVKTRDDLIKQGYPASLADTAARKHILGGK